MDKNWSRWILASVNQHFIDEAQGVPVFLEGTIRDTRTIKDFYEVRVDGPDSTELSRNY